MSRSWSRLDGVDLLRGLAILLVLMNHVNMRLLFAHVHYTRGLPRPLVTALVWNGQLGVQMFFAVSGFLITSTSLRRWGSLGAVSMKGFYLLRFARIAPLLLMLLAILSVLHLAHLRDFVVSAKEGGLPAALFAALTFHVNLFEATRGYLPGNWDILWSLSVEETFYLVFPVAALLLGRSKQFAMLLLLFVVLGPLGRTVLTHGNEVWQEYSYLGGTDAIAMGCLTALLLQHRHRLSAAGLRACLVAGTILTGFMLFFSAIADAWGLERTGLGMSLMGLGTSLLIAFFAQTPWKASRLFSPLLSIGQRSYEIYLTHMFVVFACFHLFVHFGKPLHWAWPLFGVVILLAGLIGELVAHGYSEPMNRWLRRHTGEGASHMGTVVDTGDRVIA